MAQYLSRGLDMLNIGGSPATATEPGAYSWIANGRRFCQNDSDVYVLADSKWVKLQGPQVSQAIRLRLNSPIQATQAFHPAQSIQPTQVSPAAQASSSEQAGANRRCTEATTRTESIPLVTPKFFSNSAVQESLHPDFQQKKNPSKFFRFGRVFETSWFDPAEDNTSLRSYQPTQAKRQKFVVVRTGDENFTALPITTYDGKGVAQHGVIKSQHAIVYTGRNPPEPTHKELPKRGEKPMLAVSFRVVTDDPSSALDRMSRIDFGQIYTFEHSVKVKAFGTVHHQSMSEFANAFRLVFVASASNERSNAQDETSADIVTQGVKGGEGDERPNVRDKNSANNITRGVKAEEQHGAEHSEQDSTEESSTSEHSTGQTPIRPSPERLTPDTNGFMRIRRLAADSTARASLPTTNGNQGNRKTSARATICSASSTGLCFECRLDSGADADFITRDAVQRLGLKEHLLQTPKQVDFGNGESMLLRSYVSWCWRLDDARSGTSGFYVVQHMVYDVILGVYTMGQYGMLARDVHVDQSEKDRDPFRLDIWILGESKGSYNLSVPQISPVMLTRCIEKQQKVIQSSKSSEAASKRATEAHAAQKRNELNRLSQQQAAQNAQRTVSSQRRQPPTPSQPAQTHGEQVRAWARQPIDDLRRQRRTNESAREAVLASIQQRYSCSRETAQQYLPSQ